MRKVFSIWVFIIIICLLFSVPVSASYENHCWRCDTHISSTYCKKCPECGWYYCVNCGACAPGCPLCPDWSPYSDSKSNSSDSVSTKGYTGTETETENNASTTSHPILYNLWYVFIGLMALTFVIGGISERVDEKKQKKRKEEKKAELVNETMSKSSPDRHSSFQKSSSYNTGNQTNQNIYTKGLLIQNKGDEYKATNSAYLIGDKVYHEVLGSGVVCDTSLPGGNPNIIKVNFESFGIKMIDITDPKLKKE